MTAISRTDVDVSTAQIITNKDLTSTTNTFPATLQRSLLVCKSAGGGTTTENGSNTWAKIATYSTGTAQFNDGSFVYSVMQLNGGAPGPETAIISVGVGSANTGSNPTVAVRMLSHGTSQSGGYWVKADSFKIVSDGWSSDMVLWMKKGNQYGQFGFYEIGRTTTANVTVTYNDGAAWQSAVPTGTVNNVQTDGITSGVKVTATGFSGPLVNAGVPAAPSSTGTPGQIGYDGGFLYICTAPNTWKRATIGAW